MTYKNFIEKKQKSIVRKLKITFNKFIGKERWENMFFRSFNNKVNGAGRALKKLECGTKINTLSFEQRLKELLNF